MDSDLQLKVPDRTRRFWVVLSGCIGIMLVTLLIEVLMGRRMFSATGKILFWVSSITSAETSQQFFDFYSVNHALHGVLLYGLVRWLGRWRKGGIALGTALLITVATEAAWEVAENSPIVINRYREATAAVGYQGDSILNSMMDIVSCATGCLLAWRLPVWVSVLFAVGSEVLLAILIRDNLTLNVIMLLFPIDAIKQWQMGG